MIVTSDVNANHIGVAPPSGSTKTPDHVLIFEGGSGAVEKE